MHQKQNKRRKHSKKFFKALHIIVITLKYAFKILKELKAIIELFNKKQKIRYVHSIPDFFGNLWLPILIWNLVLCIKSISFIIILYFIIFAIYFFNLTL